MCPGGVQADTDKYSSESKYLKTYKNLMSNVKKIGTYIVSKIFVSQ